ncbi:alpha/beta fold hydrolase [Kitasatospora paranensis]|uniref:S9 family peptidase n=1 Tax=Kitasatospora paranensis TaxID=258053 RepID=UPI0031E58DAB
MSTVARTAAQALRRLSFTFAPDGSHAACLAAGPNGGWFAESWQLPPDGSPAAVTALALPGGRTESMLAQPLALPDGRVLLCRHEGDRHALVLLAAAEEAREREIAVLRVPALRLLPLPAGAAAGGPVALALGTDARPVTTVWLVTADGGPPQPLAELPGLHGGGVWLDDTGRLLAVDRLAAGHVRTVAVDLASGAVTPLLELGEQSNDRLLRYDVRTGLGLVRSDAPGTDRLGWGLLGGAGPIRFPEYLHALGPHLQPVALAPAAAPDEGSRVVLLADRGAASTLLLWRPGSARPVPLAVPPGRFGAVAHWSAAGLRMPYSAPDHPAALATLDVDAAAAGPGAATVAAGGPLPLHLAPLHLPPPGAAHPAAGPETARIPAARAAGPAGAAAGWRLEGSTAPADGGRWHGARALQLTGAAGPVEAVVYGGDTWQAAPHLVLALHGGPADAWRLEFDPALQRMAAAGLAVVAPNQRGSSGYGPDHAAAIQDAWGGPDLDDVLHLLDVLAGQRAALGLEPPALFGVSYGGFLALLAAAHAPAGQVARCAVVAPFLSGQRLLAESAAPVRALTTRLGGDVPLDDARGPRDVLQLAHRIAAPLLILHGDRDEVVPVGQSRTLRQELLRLGRAEGAAFRYVEAVGAGHELLAEDGAAVLHELLAGFLRTGQPG